MRIDRIIVQGVRSPRKLFAAGFWYVAGKKVRARNRFRQVFGAPSVRELNDRVAEAICRRHAEVTAEEKIRMAEEIAGWPRRPLISVVMPVYDTEKSDLQAAIASVKAQIYPDWELCIADDASTNPYILEILQTAEQSDPRIRVVYRPENGHISEASNSALEMARGDFVALMDHDDLLSEHALFHVAKEIVEYPDVDLIYSDEDKIRADGSLAGPHFKPDWNEELFLTQNYINHLGVYRTSILRAIGGFRKGFEGSQDHDLALRFIARSDSSRIRHIPKILYHWRAYHGSGSFSDRALARAIDARQRAVREYLAVREPTTTVSVIRGPYGCNRVIRELPSPIPLVSLVIPTRDRVELLQKCIGSIFDKTAYPRLEVLIVDNDSTDDETLSYFNEVTQAYPVRVLKYHGPFNYSAINNFAVAHAEGSVVGLVNNDVEVIAIEWLREMVAYAVLPHIGAVGARLLYSNGLVQHAGVVLGVGGIANHAHHGYPGTDSGYQARLQLPQYVSAVTGACLIVEKDKYLAVGGLDEVNLKVAYNDVDFCLKLEEKGFQTVFTPYATLFHHESASRGSDTSPQKIARLEQESEFMREKWGKVLERDKYYNENFSDSDACFRFRGN